MDLDFYNWFLVFVRLGAFLLALPFFSAVNFPATMRVALAALSALLLAPQLPAFAISHLDLLTLVGLLAREVAIGLLFGFFARMVFFAADIAGVIISNELGLSMGSIMDPTSRQPEQVPGLILFFLATITMLSLVLHHGLLLGFAKSFEVLPLGGGHLSSALFETIVARTSQIFVIALQISAPVMAVSFCITVFFAVMSRAVPQMNVFAESFGIRIAGGLIVLGFTLQIAAQYIVNHLQRLPDDLIGLGQLLHG
jgi:flagellar biosynthetic protein FliR